MLECTLWFVSAKHSDIPTNTVGVVSGFTLNQAGTEGPLLGFVFLMGLKLLQISIPQHWILRWKLVHLSIKWISFPSQTQSGNWIKSLPFCVTSRSLLARSSSSPVLCWEPSWHPQLMAGLNFPRSNLISVQLCRLTICSLIVSLLTAFSVEQFERSGEPCFGDMEVFSHLKCNFTPCVTQ